MPVTVRRTNNKGRRRARMAAGLDRGLILAAQVVAQDAQSRAPVLTGRLSRSITAGEPYTSGKTRAIKVGTNVEYAAAQEFGLEIEPRLIYAVRKKALKFEIDGETVFAAYAIQDKPIIIPAQPYLNPAYEANKANIRRIILSSVVEAAKS